MSRITVVPRPLRVEFLSGEFLLKPDARIIPGAGTEALATRLQSELRAPTGYALPLADEGDGIHLQITSGVKHPEGYELIAEGCNVRLRAKTLVGLNHAIATLKQLLPADVFRRAPVPETRWTFPAVRIGDEPRFAWRGMHLDVARHFMPKEFLFKFVDLLALHRYNRFHLHLTEDQGWRIEIQKYPRLTEVGAWRKETMVGHYGDMKWDGKRHGGFYTQRDLRELVAYATERGVTIMPEIEMPGHAQAAIAAYPELGNFPEKQLEVYTSWGISENVFNAEDSTIRFLQDVLEETLDIFPSEFIHIGGDECPKKQWKQSARAQELMKQRGIKDEDGLQSWFIHQMDRFLDGKGRRLVGWDEILEGGLADGATVMSWRGEEGGIAAAKAGHDVIMTPGSHTYFDHYQVKDTREEPVAIGGFTDVEKVYGYEPVPEELNEEEAKRVLGSQGQLWSEYIQNPKQMERMMFPRAAALSEVVWLPAAEKDFGDFSARLRAHRARLAALDVHAHPKPE